MSEREVDYYSNRVLRLEEDKARLQIELFAAQFDATCERAMKKQIWALCMTMMIATGVLVVVFGIVLSATRG
jgi:type IV secretory pathway VirD2 relaxase